MTRQVINTGTVANDGTGDSLRQAGTKINANFKEIYTLLGDSNVASAHVSLDSDTLVFTGTSFTAKIGYTEPTANRSILIPNASGTIVLATGSNLILPGILDSSSNEIIKLGSVASAVNEVSITNAATLNKPTISATGNDTNITLKLNAKGVGSVELNKAAFTSSTIIADGAASTTASHIILNKATALAVTLNNGTTSGEIKIFTNKGAGLATITPARFARGTSLRLPTKTGAQLIWDDSDWYLFGADSSVTVI